MSKRPQPELLETAELAAFVRTVEAGSLSRAASELGVPRATLGRRLARLEERLGTRLLRRTTRKLVLTDEGRVLYETGKSALAAMRDAVESVGQKSGVIRGRLRVSMPPMSDPALHAMIARFGAAHPDVTMEITFSTTAVSFGEDGYDLALRASTAIDPSLVARPLGVSQLVAVASPSYLAAHGTPRTVADLAHHACMRHFTRGETPSNEWPTPNGSIRVDGPLATNEIQLQVDAARAGLGIALVPDLITFDAVARGELVRILEGQVGVMTTIAVVYPERRLLRPVVRAFVEELVAWARTEMARRPVVRMPKPALTSSRRRIDSREAARTSL